MPIPRCGGTNTSPATWPCSFKPSDPASKRWRMRSMRDLLAQAEAASAAADRLVAAARRTVGALLADAGGEAFDRHQYPAHGFAWFATYAQALRQLWAWAAALAD